MAKIKATCPRCKNKMDFADVPKPGEAIVCSQCGTSFPFSLGSSKATQSEAVREPADLDESKQKLPSMGLWPKSVMIIAVGGLIGVGSWFAINRATPAPNANSTQELTEKTATKVATSTEPRSGAEVVESSPSKEKIAAVSKSMETKSKTTIARADKNPETSTKKPGPSPETQSPPRNWRETTGTVFATGSKDEQESKKQLGIATAVAPKKFVTRALPILSTGVKDPLKDDVRIEILVGEKKFQVTKIAYHPKVPIAKLAEGKLEQGDYLTMMLNDVAVLSVTDDSALVDPHAQGFSEAITEEQPAHVVGNRDSAGPLQLLGGKLLPRARKPEESLLEVRVDATEFMEGAPVYVGDRLLGLLLVKLDDNGMAVPPHHVLPVSRIREAIAGK